MTVRQGQRAGIALLNYALFAVSTGAMFFGTVMLSGCGNRVSAASAGARPPMKVTVVSAAQSDVPITDEWVGTLDGYVNGLVSLLTLPISQYPDIVPPEILVTATYPGADAKTVSQAVSTPLEQQMNGVDNMIYMDSVSANNGVAQIFVDFDVKTNPNIDQVLAQLRVDQAQSQLPAQVTTAGLTVQKALTSPLMLVAVNSPTGELSQDSLTNYAIINLQDQLARVKGVSRVQVFGGQYALRVWVEPDKLAKLGVTATDVIRAIQTQNNVNPAGQIGGEPIPKGQQFTYTVRTQGRLVTPEEFGNIILRANPDGSILHLSDVARVELGDQAYGVSARYNQAPSGVMAIYQLPGSNAVETAAAVNQRMKELATTFPPSISYSVPLDTTKAVTAGIREILLPGVHMNGLQVHKTVKSFSIAAAFALCSALSTRE